MKDNRMKEKVLKDIREAMMDRNATTGCDVLVSNGNTFIDTDDDLAVVFAQNFTKAGGTLFYCYSENDIKERILEIQARNGDLAIGCSSENLTGFLHHLEVSNSVTSDLSMSYPLGATLCEALLAWQGGIVISSNLGLGLTTPALYDTTIVLAFTSQVVTDWEVANERLKQLYDVYPEQLVVVNPFSYAFRKGQQKLYLILIEDETN